MTIRLNIIRLFATQRILPLLATVLAAVSGRAELPKYDVVTSSVPTSQYGTITRLSVTSQNLRGKVTIDVWTPSVYDPDAEVTYPVLYAHDGQNLFDSKFTFAGVAWEVDKACWQLAADPDFVMPIVVGINNRGAQGLRPNDYFPEKALGYISPDQKEETFIYDTCKDMFYGDDEAAFVTDELKPLIDTLYRTAPGMETTFAMGSSMGALASMYLLCEHPQVFGGAACLSTHWIGSLDLNPDYTMNDDEVCANAIMQYLSDHIPSDGLHRLYMDQGTKDWDAGYLKYEVEAREIVRDHGYSEEEGTLYVYDAKGAGHNEWYWQQRVKLPLKFLLSRSAIDSAAVPGLPADTPIPSSDLIYDLAGRPYSPALVDRLPSGLYIHHGKTRLKR